MSEHYGTELKCPNCYETGQQMPLCYTDPGKGYDRKMQKYLCCHCGHKYWVAPSFEVVK